MKPTVLTLALLSGIVACQPDSPVTPVTEVTQMSQIDLPPGLSLENTAAGDALNAPFGVQGATINHFFCFFVFTPPLVPSVTGYSGHSNVVQAPNGRTNYSCNADLLFGPGVNDIIRLRDVRFTTFTTGTMQPCQIQTNPHGEALVSCHDEGD
jgi:hypothetical protein